jgi:ribonuclease PH
MTARSGDRGPEELRTIRVTRRYLKHAMGSCIFELGDTRVLCAASVDDGSAPGAAREGLATAEYSMLPASTHAIASRR